MHSIIIVVPSSHYGGGESYISNLCYYFAKKNVKIYLFSACRKLNADLEHIISELIYIKPCTSLGFNTYSCILKINRFLKESRVDCVFLNGLPEMGVYSRFIKSDGDIYSIGHSNEFWMLDKPKFFSKRYLKRLITSGYGKFLTGVIAINKLAFYNISQNPDLSNKVKLIYNGVSPIRIEKSSVGVEQNFIVFGRISRMVAGKGNELLLLALANLKNIYPEIRLVLAGDGPELEGLKKLSHSLGLDKHVSFCGFVSPEVFFSKIDCMISPSLMEATPMVILESFSCYIPVLSSNVGGVPDLIEHLKTGYLFKAGSVEEIIMAMCYFIENKDGFCKISLNAYNTYSDNFTSDDMGLNTFKYFFKER
ncbi:glycosyltransferase family 4 protein [Shewanella mangrovisoli]|uniref:glycosyltransferase family 4 protein n=1 Tax=Shewanella mangrovisoli TaxID=2864211 RepID=UPI0035BB10F8